MKPCTCSDYQLVGCRGEAGLGIDWYCVDKHPNGPPAMARISASDLAELRALVKAATLAEAAGVAREMESRMDARSQKTNDQAYTSSVVAGMIADRIATLAPTIYVGVRQEVLAVLRELAVEMVRVADEHSYFQPDEAFIAAIRAALDELGETPP